MFTSQTLVLPARREPLPIRPVYGLWISASMVLLWSLWAAWFNVGQFGDNIEQFNWAQSLEWGYHKHPPLPTWLLHGFIALFGTTPYGAYALAAASLLGTAGFTWLIGRRLLGERVASVALVLWGLHLCFSQRAQLYNHNTVLVLCMAATVWAALRARDGAWPWWLLTGAAAGAALLSKYQALVPLGGLLLALGLSGSLRRRSQRLGLIAAILTMLAVVAPHAAWVVHHDFTTLRYASDAVEHAGPLQRAGFVASFFANQLRIVSPSLVTMAICGWLMRRGDLRRPEAVVTRAPGDVPSREFGAWSVGLIGATTCVLVLMALAAGVSLRNHWGVQTFQFLCLWLAYRWDRGTPIDLRRLLQVALLVHGVLLAAYAAEHRDPRGVVSKRRIDTMYPAQRIADAASRHWHERTDCPLRYVGGDVFIAGMASLYSPAHPKVFDSPHATPWIAPDALAADGMLYIVDENDTLPAGLETPEVFSLVLDEQVHHLAKTIRFAARLPAQPCP